MVTADKGSIKIITKKKYISKLITKTETFI